MGEWVLSRDFPDGSRSDVHIRALPAVLQEGDLQERGNAAAICNVRLGKGYATAIDVVLEHPNRSQVLTRRTPPGKCRTVFANL